MLLSVLQGLGLIRFRGLAPMIGRGLLTLDTGLRTHRAYQSSRDVIKIRGLRSKPPKTPKMPHQVDERSTSFMFNVVKQKPFTTWTPNEQHTHDKGDGSISTRD